MVLTTVDRKTIFTENQYFAINNMDNSC